ncbi:MULTISPECIES: hypothetical protein [Vibrio]|uniref:hypothetical protein n=1 Tax=Vibrio TaxID=662 RepID=UPI000633C83E|nr:MULTISPECIES: hypothetical protein [Vibrio]PMG52533.1 hypothetical protein BCU89_20395 [Vibrio splendidus]CDU14385.1 Hypothetical protein VCR17J2_640067 [Vibrio coralliirubri]
MMNTHQRGRPALSPVVKLAKHVVKDYQDYVSLNLRYQAQLRQLYPEHNAEQLALINADIISASEEYKIWSSIDNLMLSAQRHSDPIQQWQSIQEKVLGNVLQLISLYQLRIRSLPAQPRSILVCDFADQLWLHEQAAFSQKGISQTVISQTLVSQTVTSWLESTLVKATGFQQDDWFYTVTENLKSSIRDRNGALLNGSESLNNFLSDDTSFVLERIKHQRKIIRLLMLHIIDNKMDSLLPRQAQSSAGRPALPLPVQLMRQEQALQDTYLEYRKACHAHNQAALSIETLAAKALEKNSKATTQTKAGRKPMSELQKLVNQSLVLEDQILCREHQLNERSIDCSNLKTNQSNDVKRGRPTLSPQDQIARLKTKFDNINQAIEQLKSKTKSANADTIERNILKYQSLWLTNKIAHADRILAKQESPLELARRRKWAQKLLTIRSTLSKI